MSYENQHACQKVKYLKYMSLQVVILKLTLKDICILYLIVIFSTFISITDHQNGKANYF